MFGKIKDKLKSVFSRNEKIIEEEDKNEENLIETKNENLDEDNIDNGDNLNKNNLENDENLKTNEIRKEKTKFEKDKSKKISEDNDEKLDDYKEDEKDNDEDLDIKKKEDKKDEKEVVEEKIKEKKTKEKEIEKKGFFSSFTKKKISLEDYEKIWIELELFLLEINVAFEIVEKINEKLKSELIGYSFSRFSLSEKIKKVLEEEVEEVLEEREADFLSQIKEIKNRDEIVKILILGVNGTGKTTSIAKIVHYLKKNNLSVVVAASDTFRAAATEQLQEHSKKIGFKLIIHKGGSDPAAVAFDAIEHAKAKNLDVVLIDTAGRMPNNSNLMMELIKIKRVAGTQISLFIGDSIAGNDLMEQIDLFDKGLKIDGIILTKVDTDERPGSIVTCAYSINKPIYFLGNGQNYDDLMEFNGKKIAKQLFDINED